MPKVENAGAGAGGGILGHGFVEATYDQIGDMDLKVQVDAEVAPVLDLNLEPDNPLDLDLNAPVDMQEMVINPILPDPRQHEIFLELNDLLNQVNENDEDMLQEEIQHIDPLENFDMQVNAPDNVEVHIPALNGPRMDALPLEIQEEDLMNDEEIQQQLEEEAA
jgi:hypothetical protein